MSDILTITLETFKNLIPYDKPELLDSNDPFLRVPSIKCHKMFGLFTKLHEKQLIDMKIGDTVRYFIVTQEPGDTFDIEKHVQCVEAKLIP